MHMSYDSIANHEDTEFFIPAFLSVPVTQRWKWSCLSPILGFATLPSSHKISPP